MTSQTYEQYFTYTFDLLTLAAGSGTAFTDVTPVQLDPNADFILYGISHVATDNRINVRLVDQAIARSFQGPNQSNGVDIMTWSAPPLTGGVLPNGFKPLMLPTPTRFPASDLLTVSLADFSGVANSARITMHGSKVFNGPAPWDPITQYSRRFTYWYTGSLALAANETNVLTIQIANNADFLVHKLTARRTGAATVMITSGATDQHWFDKAVHIDNMFGFSQYPNILPKPRFLLRNSVTEVLLTDLSGVANTINLTLEGTWLEI